MNIPRPTAKRLSYYLRELESQADSGTSTISSRRLGNRLGLTDAQLGFLYGTAFAVFYAVFGIPLGRLADIWVRRKLIATGLRAPRR